MAKRATSAASCAEAGRTIAPGTMPSMAYSRSSWLCGDNAMRAEHAFEPGCEIGRSGHTCAGSVSACLRTRISPQPLLKGKSCRD